MEILVSKLRGEMEMLTLEDAIKWFNKVASKVKEVPNANRRRQLAAILLSLFYRTYCDLLTEKYKSKYIMPYTPTHADFRAAEEIALDLLTTQDKKVRAERIAKLREAMFYYFENFHQWKDIKPENVLSFRTFQQKLPEIYMALPPIELGDEGDSTL